MRCTTRSITDRFFKVWISKDNRCVFVNELENEDGDIKQINFHLSRPIGDKTIDDCFYDVCKQMRSL